MNINKEILLDVYAFLNELADIKWDEYEEVRNFPFAEDALEDYHVLLRTIDDVRKILTTHN